MSGRCYISGPMTGIADFNYPAFNEAEVALRALGWDVVNPTHNFHGETGRPRRDYMRADIKHVLGVDTVFLLPGWEASEGSRLEVLIAQELGLLICEWNPATHSATFLGDEKVVTSVEKL